MPKKQATTIVNFILDESSSMSAVRDATISGFNEYVDTLKKKAEGKVLFNLVTFDTEMSQIYEHEPIKNVKLSKRTYDPNGCTALYDAVVETVEKAAKKDDKEHSNLVVIMTDGEENSSRLHNMDCLNDVIKKLEKKGNWTFTFLGANQDSWDTAGQFGVAMGNTVNYDSSTKEGMENAFRGLSGSTVNFCSAMQLNAAGGGGGGSTKDFYQGKKDLSK